MSEVGYCYDQDLDHFVQVYMDGGNMSNQLSLQNGKEMQEMSGVIGHSKRKNCLMKGDIPGDMNSSSG